MRNHNSPSTTRSGAALIPDALRRFLDTENAAAKVLAVATSIALLWANSPWAQSYVSLWTDPLPATVRLSGRIPDLRHVVNDLLMTVFFFVVALEIRRELVEGDLRTWRKASLPIAAALGGMIVPAGIFAVLNGGTETASGWGIPIATDIAFAVALVTALKAVPRGLRLFLLSLAIVDDILAIGVIALFYADAISVGWLLVFGTACVAAALVTRTRPCGLVILLAWALVLWVSALNAGIHPTVAGVVLAFVGPIARTDETAESLETLLHPVTGFLIVPLFALANAGVQINGSSLAEVATSSLGMGIVLGAIVGKIVGVGLFSWLSLRLGLSLLPEGINPSHMIGAAAAAGIGFTVSIFISDLAFSDARLVEQAKLAVLLSSVGAAALSVGIFRWASKRP